MKRRDNFLNYTSAEMMTCTEDCIAGDLGMSFDYEGKLSENIVRENFSSFFKFYNSDFNGIDVDDIVENEEYAIVGFVQDGQYTIVSKKFTLSTKAYDHSKKQRWDAVNIACALYLGLDADTSNYTLKLE